MTLRYTYHSEHHADRQDRWIHFLLYAGAFLLFLAGLYELFLFFTDWNGAEGEHSYWYLLFGLGYLLIGGLLAYTGYRYNNHQGDASERFVRMNATELSWNLEQEDKVHRVLLADIQSVEHPNVRDLVLNLKDEGRQVLPIYLIANPEKQQELIDLVMRQSEISK